jgi:hypothetical protein
MLVGSVNVYHTLRRVIMWITYFGPKQPWLPFENGTRYRLKVDDDDNHRSGWKVKGSGKMVASRRTK